MLNRLQREFGDMAKFHGISARSRVDALRIAATNSMLKEVRALIDDGVNMDAIASDGLTALSAASRQGLLKSIEALLEAGADVNVTDKDDLTPLMRACSTGKAKGSKAAVRLIEASADVSYVRKSDGMTALKFAVKRASPEVIQLLIDEGADVDGPPKTKQTALMIAARHNNVANLRVLVESGADLDRPCRLPWAENKTALGIAELEKRRQAASFLRAAAIEE